ncbi:MAG: HemK/PrmC family methyltransferase, partial [Anaerolineaceae bacterium]|nr:HemK/PrmC family methyltransferase [Anaerolineaceae bacterium]
FFGLDFLVSPAVLIPRPETELLVEHAVQWLRQNPGRRLAADVGTGSGCIAISIANQIPDLTVLASDYSDAALRIARANVSRYRLDHRIHLVQADLMTAAAGSFDLVCANLPYIPTSTLEHLQVSRYEPRLALDGGSEGLDFIQKLLFDAVAKLAPGALFLLEIETRQADAVIRLARLSYPSAEATVIPDLAGIPRLLRIKLQ